MANYLLDNDDLLFYLDKGIDWDPIVRLTERDFIVARRAGQRGRAICVYWG